METVYFFKEKMLILNNYLITFSSMYKIYVVFIMFVCIFMLKMYMYKNTEFVPSLPITPPLRCFGCGLRYCS